MSIYMHYAFLSDVLSDYPTFTQGLGAYKNKHSFGTCANGFRLNIYVCRIPRSGTKLNPTIRSILKSTKMESQTDDMKTLIFRSRRFVRTLNDLNLSPASTGNFNLFSRHSNISR